MSFLDGVIDVFHTLTCGHCRRTNVIEPLRQPQERIERISAETLPSSSDLPATGAQLPVAVTPNVNLSQMKRSPGSFNLRRMEIDSLHSENAISQIS